MSEYKREKKTTTNNQATLDRLRKLKLTGMFEAFEALLRLPAHQQPAADQLLAQLTDAEYEYRQHRRTQMAIRAARFRYQVSLEELHYGANRNLYRFKFSVSYI